MSVVVAGRGLVGSRTVAELAQRGIDSQLVPGRDAVTRGRRNSARVVVLAGPTQTQLPLARRLVAAGRSVIATADGLADVSSLVGLDASARAHGATLVVGAAFSPGLSTLMAVWLAARFDEVSEISTASFGTGGPACARSHHAAMGASGHEVCDGRLVRVRAGSRRRLVWFPEPIGGADCFAVGSAEPDLLHRARPDVPMVNTAMACTRRDRLTARLPMLRPPHPEGLIGGLVVEVRGRRGSTRDQLLVGCAVPQATGAAAMAASMVVELLDERLPAGVTSPAEMTDPARTVAQVARTVRLQSFDGSVNPEPHGASTSIARKINFR